MRYGPRTEVEIFELIYAGGLEEYPTRDIIRRSVVLGVKIGVGTAACWLLSPILGSVYLALALLMMGIVLPKLLCVHCYYYGRRCSTGWGKVVPLLFNQGNMRDFNAGIGQIVAMATHGLLYAVPVVALLLLMAQQLTVASMLLLVVLLVVALCDLAILRRKACAECKMRRLCRGCRKHAE